MIEQSAVDKLGTALRGGVLCVGQAGYDAARTIHNRSIDRRPAIIARCAGTADVVACVRFGREHDLLVSVRGGGHSVAGQSVCDGGLMIDLSGMKGIHVDPAGRTVRAEAGLTLGEFDRETQAFGLATPLGVISKTGIAGLTLGGGLGWLLGKHGLACDNLISADVVTADGRLLKASATENDDLFWGVRGGGGNFGIVTSLEYRLHELGPVMAGAVLYPAAKAGEVVRFYREFTSACPDEITLHAGRMTTPDGDPVMAVAGLYCGSPAQGEEEFKPLRTFGPPIADMFGVIGYVQMQSMFDDAFPPGRDNYWKANFIRGLSDEAIETFAEYAQTTPSVYTTGPWLDHFHGAAARVKARDTAFAHRQHPYNFSIFSSWVDPAEAEKNLKWTRECWDAMRPFMAEGAYVNYLEDEADPLARAAYGANHARLAMLKSKYDPTNFFRMNHNIKPSRAA